MADHGIVKKKILWRAKRRGTKEMDYIIGNFARQNVPSMDSETLQEFAKILDVPDPILSLLIIQDQPHELPLNENLLNEIKKSIKA